MSLVQDHICLPLLPDATVALTIITQLITAGNGIFGKLIVNRCARTDGDILLSIWSYLVLLEGIILNSIQFISVHLIQRQVMAHRI